MSEQEMSGIFKCICKSMVGSLKGRKKTWLLKPLGKKSRFYVVPLDKISNDKIDETWVLKACYFYNC